MQCVTKLQELVAIMNNITKKHQPACVTKLKIWINNQNIHHNNPASHNAERYKQWKQYHTYQGHHRLHHPFVFYSLIGSLKSYNVNLPTTLEGIVTVVNFFQRERVIFVWVLSYFAGVGSSIDSILLLAMVVEPIKRLIVYDTHVIFFIICLNLNLYKVIKEKNFFIHNICVIQQQPWLVFQTIVSERSSLEIILLSFTCETVLWNNKIY